MTTSLTINDMTPVAASMSTTLMATATTLTTTLGIQPTNTTAPGSPTEGRQAECRLLGPFALVVQAALGGLALLSLVYKRWKERPQRPIKIWWFDASKQVFGSVLVHVVNVFMSMLTSGRISLVDPTLPPPPPIRRAIALLTRSDPYQPNPCSFYLLNLAIDTTVGIPILIGLLRLTTRIISCTSIGQPPESIQSGYYGRPPKSSWWLKQSLIYFCGLLGMKIVVLFIFLLFPFISLVGDWALKWTEGNERLQIVFVMLLFPLLMNAMQYYIIDSFIKESSHTALYSEVGGDEDEDEDEDEDDAPFHGSNSRKFPESDDELPTQEALGNRTRRPHEYDPSKDVDRRKVARSHGSVSSRQSPASKPIPSELFPRE